MKAANEAVLGATQHDAAKVVIDTTQRNGGEGGDRGDARCNATRHCKDGDRSGAAVVQVWGSPRLPGNLGDGAGDPCDSRAEGGPSSETESKCWRWSTALSDRESRRREPRLKQVSDGARAEEGRRRRALEPRAGRSALRGAGKPLWAGSLERRSRRCCDVSARYNSTRCEADSRRQNRSGAGRTHQVGPKRRAAGCDPAASIRGERQAATWRRRSEERERRAATRRRWSEGRGGLRSGGVEEDL
ncbi:uncharacterized protein PSFLO_06851 [Pseudozyma flocculosa]|uniref:Uncharacterized protein n=1 Tax=Pseudozyma flocculosa TaxID=84751 RepID=A0A5C3FDD4_9BASI|nr:uncharacterized protein PSFLO_06851 [Pseudozyma flocculosa]